MNIVITGASGFIGSNLCNYLKFNNNILAITRSAITNTNNIQSLQCDLSDINFHSNVFDEFKPDILIHCAWMGGNNFKDIDSIIQYENIKISLNLFDFFKKYNISKIICLGSSSEYGKYFDKVSEDDICNPYNLYGQSKLYLRHLLNKLSVDFGINFSWIIPMYLYGPNDVSTRFIPKIISHCLNNDPLHLNSCDTLIDYLYIGDFCQAVNYIIVDNLQGVFNISSGITIPAKSVVEKIISFTDYNNSVFYDENLDRNNFQKYFCSSSDKISKISNWKPSTSFDDGIIKTINSMKNKCIKYI